MAAMAIGVRIHSLMVSDMPSISVRYFASLRERLGRSEELVEAAGLACVADVWSRVSSEPLPANCLVAINQEYAAIDSQVQAGDEVAFFPPVTGG
jgi:sulfur-carrier protein